MLEGERWQRVSGKRRIEGKYSERYGRKLRVGREENKEREEGKRGKTMERERGRKIKRE